MPYKLISCKHACIRENSTCVQQTQAEKEHVRLHNRNSERAKVHVHVHEHRLNNGRIAKQEQHGRTLQGK